MTESCQNETDEYRKRTCISETEMDIKIVVATHKPYWMPEDPVYYPVFVGAEGKTKIGLCPDNTGENISARNDHYCELTGLYWAWKNLDADYLGLVHYRRHFSSRRWTADKKKRVADGRCLERELEKAPILLPKPRHYWIETTYTHYAHAHHSNDLDTARAVLAENDPEYVPAFDAVMNQTSGHRFNMFVMRRDLLNQYCEWLFQVLFEMEKRLDISTYSANDARVFGFVGERLLDVWIQKNDFSYSDLPYVFLDKQNWPVKAYRFLKRKWDRKRTG